MNNSKNLLNMTKDPYEDIKGKVVKREFFAKDKKSLGYFYYRKFIKTFDQISNAEVGKIKYLINLHE